MKCCYDDVFKTEHTQVVPGLNFVNTNGKNLNLLVNVLCPFNGRFNNNSSTILDSSSFTVSFYWLNVAHSEVSFYQVIQLFQV